MFIILMATYNGEKYINEQIDSILNQTYTDWCLLISDDGSNDGTIDIIKQYRSQYPEKIKLIINEGKEHGAKANFRYLLRMAPPSDYYVLCDQDDVWMEDKLEVLLGKFQTLDNQKPQFIYHEMQVVDADLRLLGNTFSDYSGLYLKESKEFAMLMLRNYIPGCSMSFNQALMKYIVKMPENVGMHDWWIALTAAAFGEIHNVKKKLSMYRQHENNCIGVRKKRIISIVQMKNQMKKLKNDALYQNEALLMQFKKELKYQQQALLKKTIYDLKLKNNIFVVLRNMKRHHYIDGKWKSIVFWYM